MSINSVGGSSNTPSIQPVINPVNQNLSGTSSVEQAVQTLEALAIAAGQPVLSLSEYFATVSSSLLEQKVQEIIAKFQDTAQRNAMYEAATGETLVLSNLISSLATYKSLQTSLDNLDLTSAANSLASSANTYNSGIDNSKVTALNNAIDAYRADPSDDNQTTLTQAIADYNAMISVVNAAAGSLNTDISNWNNLASQASSIIDSMNAIRTQLGLPPISSPTTFSSISSIPAYTYSPSSPHVDAISSFTAPIWVSPTPLDDTVTALETRIVGAAVVIDKLRGIEESEDAKELNPIDRSIRTISSTNLLGGSGASTALTTIDQTAATNNPFLASTLSKQGLDAFFNNYGVPLGSALVDQIGALITNFSSVNDLLSASDAQEILASGSVNVDGGLIALRAAAALGNLSVTTSPEGETALQNALKEILNGIPEFTALTPEVQATFVTGLAAELNGSLLRASLEEVGILLGMPGILPQVLANLAGLSTNDPLGSFQSQLFYATVLSQNLPTTVGITQEQADAVAVDVLNQALQNQEVISQQSIIDAIVAQIGQGAAASAELQAQVAQLDAVAQGVVNSQLASQQQASSEAYSDTLARSLLQNSLATQQQIAILIQDLEAATTEQFGEIALRALRSFNLSQEQINELLTQADLASQLRDTEINPAAGFISNQVVPLETLNNSFVANVRRVLAPAVHDQQALYVAENYGRLLFRSENSVINRLRSTERVAVREDASNQVDRLFEEYRAATVSLRDPLNAADSPLSNGETLLLAGMASGPSTLGILSTDKTLDPAGKQYKRPVDIPA